MREKALRLLALHRGPAPLLLPNAWDSATARILEQAGFPAVATTSAGIAFARGYPDGEVISREEMLEEVARIARAVSVPVSADMEAGYGDTPEDVHRAVLGVLDAGAVGLNLEDGNSGPGEPLYGVEAQVAKIRAVRDAAESRGVPVVLNARTDVYLDSVGPEAGRFDETVRRGRAYRDAGADCIFVPGLADERVIGALVRELACPVNILASASSPSIAALTRLGVARVSLGSAPMRAAMTLVRRLAEELQASGTYSTLEGIVTHASMNALMRGTGGRS
jgi:2-methylisocitrate lyase-like PEP mutase family enzyme